MEVEEVRVESVDKVEDLKENHRLCSNFGRGVIAYAVEGDGRVGNIDVGEE